MKEYDVRGDVSDVLGDDKSNALSGDVRGDIPDENGSGEGVWNRELLIGADLVVSGEISGSEYLSVELVCGLVSCGKQFEKRITDLICCLQYNQSKLNPL